MSPKGRPSKSLLGFPKKVRGKVIDALVEQRSHVPYRDSQLTRVLQEAETWTFFVVAQGDEMKHGKGVIQQRSPPPPDFRTLGRKKQEERRNYGSEWIRGV